MSRSFSSDFNYVVNKLTKYLYTNELLSLTQYTAVDLATGYWPDGRGSISGWGKNFLFHSVQIGSGAHPASYTKGTGALSSGIKRLGREADHSLPSSAEVKNGKAIRPLPHTLSWRGA
jgi:hypothetical protein